MIFVAHICPAGTRVVIVVWISSILQFNGYVVQRGLRCEQAYLVLYKLSLVLFPSAICETNSTWQHICPTVPLTYSSPSEIGKQMLRTREKKTLAHQPKSRSLVLLRTFPEPLVNWHPLRISLCLCQGLERNWRALKPISDNIDGIISTLVRLLLQDRQSC